MNTALHRLRESGKVLRFSDGWALASLYPPHIRASAQRSQKINRTEGAGQAENEDNDTQPEETETAEHPEKNDSEGL